MIDLLINGYNKHKGTLREQIIAMNEDETYQLSYKGLYALLLEKMEESGDINMYHTQESIGDVWLDSYQGDLFIIFKADHTAYCTHIEYGSCSVCDSFLRAIDSDDREQVADDLLTLLLHMVQNTKYLCRHC